MKKIRMTKINYKGNEGYMCECRIPHSERKEDWHYYEMRHKDDDWSEPITIENGVLVNFFGTVMFKESIDYLMKPWAKGRYEVDLTNNEIDDFMMLLQECYDIDHSCI